MVVGAATGPAEAAFKRIAVNPTSTLSAAAHFVRLQHRGARRLAVLLLAPRRHQRYDDQRRQLRQPRRHPARADLRVQPDRCADLGDPEQGDELHDRLRSRRTTRSPRAARSASRRGSRRPPPPAAASSASATPPARTRPPRSTASSTWRPTARSYFGVGSAKTDVPSTQRDQQRCLAPRGRHLHLRHQRHEAVRRRRPPGLGHSHGPELRAGTGAPVPSASPAGPTTPPTTTSRAPSTSSPSTPPC